ncbi:MAG: transcription antitermination factor NusB [Candidatus Sumerlaeia bacterium]|nr:transcription antitermination factor NusB [Candidatus Sumerlaeia bacterium]
MSRRRRSREAAFQVLFAMGFTGQDRQEAALHVQTIASPDVRPHDPLAARLLGLVEQHGPAIDAALAKALKNWAEERLSPATHALLRLGTAELLHCNDIPPRVTLNEYIELARTFGDEETPKFVNGVLDRVLRDSGRAEPKKPSPERAHGGA